MTNFTWITIKAFVFLGITILTACQSDKRLPDYIQVDTLTADKFFSTESICDFAVARNYRVIAPQIIAWATDSADLTAESYIINGKRLTIFQPLKRFDIQDSARRYSYGKSAIRTVRVIIDTLNFNFNNIAFDYGTIPKNVFQKGNFILLRNEPTDWSGLANRYSFIQLFDLTKLVCYEFFVDYYSCAGKEVSVVK